MLTGTGTQPWFPPLWHEVPGGDTKKRLVKKGDPQTSGRKEEENEKDLFTGGGDLHGTFADSNHSKLFHGSKPHCDRLN